MTINDALALHHAGRLDEAERAYRQVLAAQPNQYHALHFLGVLKAQVGDMAASAELIGRSLALHADNAVAQFHMAEALRKLGRHGEATEHYRRAVTLDPALIPGYTRLGGCLVEAGHAAEALAVCEAGLKRASGEADLYACRGDALLALERGQEALAAYDRAIALDPGLVGALIGRARLVFQDGQSEAAFAALASAIAAHPEAVEPHISKAILLAELGRRDDALVVYQEALGLDPACEDTYFNMGCLLLDIGALEPAVAAFDSALAIRPNFEMAAYNRAFTLEELGRRDEAVAACEQALHLNPESGLAAGKAFFLRALDCDWRRRPDEIARLDRLARAGAKIDPFFLLSAVDDPDLHRIAARRRSLNAAPTASARALNDKLRIAYISPDFHAHPVAHHLVSVIEAHDRARFEIVGVCVKDGPDSAIRQRLQHAVDHFVAAGKLSNHAIAAVLKERGIDIAVDLAGYTVGGRTTALAIHPAPITVGWLGYPGTTGASYIDYIVADPVLIPPEDEHYYTEKVVRLPLSYLARDIDVTPGPCPSRRDLGLPQDGFVFCGFNNTYKLNPEIFAVWMRLLKAVAGSVLWLNIQNERACANLRREAETRGVPAERLVFAPRVEARADHLSRLAASDLFLDTMPYGAHSTASDMLWAGVPVLTITGRSFASRVAAGMLTALGQTGLVAPDLGTYETTALALARDPARLAALRKQLAATAPTAAVFDPALFCRSLESAYESMAGRHRAGQPAASFSVTLPPG